MEDVGIRKNWEVDKEDANASTKLLHANPTVMKIKEYIDLISKLLINFTAEQKYCIAQLKQILTSLPLAMSPRTNEGQNGPVLPTLCNMNGEVHPSTNEVYTWAECQIIDNMQELHYLFEEGHLGQQSEGGVILKLFILFNTARSCLIQQIPGLRCMMCRKSGGPCQEESLLSHLGVFVSQGRDVDPVSTAIHGSPDDTRGTWKALLFSHYAKVLLEILTAKTFISTYEGCEPNHKCSEFTGSSKGQARLPLIYVRHGQSTARSTIHLGRNCVVSCVADPLVQFHSWIINGKASVQVSVPAQFLALCKIKFVPQLTPLPNPLEVNESLFTDFIRFWTHSNPSSVHDL
ncbi:hypothetical protein Anapl_00042 [Anas platyrhynchos]|uniref:Uncharacterized protein n=1 Tax=Anas platyrhynchos TaxID=8839 RepID=R0K2H6_ANAPL|nr:hypothetical protein Anapl_00042 [Anas platyrhynchos]